MAAVSEPTLSKIPLVLIDIAWFSCLVVNINLYYVYLQLYN